MQNVPADTLGAQPMCGYPERFRVRLAGRIDQVWISAVDAKPVYRAELVVAKSKSLQQTSALNWTGMPVVEPPGEDLEEEIVPNTEQGVLASSTVNTTMLQTVPHLDASCVLGHPSQAPLTPGRRVVLIWHGQRVVPGVLAGSLLRCSGMLSQYSGEPRIYNPRYEIVPQILMERIQDGR